MPRLYRAVPLDTFDAWHLPPYTSEADSDLDAMERAKGHFGPDVPFALWDGERRALTHTPLAYLKRTAPRAIEVLD